MLKIPVCYQHTGEQDYLPMKSNLSYTADELKCIGLNAEKKQIFALFSENNEIFTKAPKGSKGGYSGWTENLLTPSEAQYRLDEYNDNIGIKLGEAINGEYLVCFDKESGGSVPERFQKFAEQYALAIWQSPHGGTNYLVSVTPTAFELLDTYKQKVYITDDERHDLEILTSKHCLIPPSEIDHSQCSEKKPCNGTGLDEYSLVELNPQADSVTRDIAEENIIEELPVREQSDDSGSSTSSTSASEEIDLPKLPDSFNPEQYHDSNIPGNDSFRERLDAMISGELMDDRFQQLWFGHYNDRSRSELKLRSYVAWAFCGDRNMVQYIFEQILPAYRDRPTKYEMNEYHANDVLNIEVNPPFYCPGISFELRKQTAKQMMELERTTVDDLTGELFYVSGGSIHEYGDDSIRNALQLLEKQGLVERISNTEYVNDGITQDYVDEIDNLIDEYDYNVTEVIFGGRYND